VGVSKIGDPDRGFEPGFQSRMLAAAMKTSSGVSPFPLAFRVPGIMMRHDETRR